VVSQRTTTFLFKFVIAVVVGGAVLRLGGLPQRELARVTVVAAVCGIAWMLVLELRDARKR
jgi:hypothetical protein